MVKNMRKNLEMINIKFKDYFTIREMHVGVGSSVVLVVFFFLFLNWGSFNGCLFYYYAL